MTEFYLLLVVWSLTMLYYLYLKINIMKRKFYLGFVMLAAWTMTMVSCDKDDDDVPPPSGDTIEITDGCAMRMGSIDPSVDEFSIHDLILFEKGINPDNFYINGYGELGSGWVLKIDCCCLNEEVAKLERGENQKTCYDLLVSGTYTWDGSEEDKHLRIEGISFYLYENDRRIEQYFSNNGDIKSCTVEIKRGHLGEQYEVSGEISLTNGKKFSLMWKGGPIQHRYNAQ